MDEAIVKEREREETGLRQRKKDRGSLTRGSWFPRLRSIPPPSLASLSPLHTTLLLVLLFRLVLPRSNNSPSRRLLSFYSVIRLSPFNSLEKKKECSFLVSHYRDYIQPLLLLLIPSPWLLSLFLRPDEITSSSAPLVRSSVLLSYVRGHSFATQCAQALQSRRAAYMYIYARILIIAENGRGERERRNRQPERVHDRIQMRPVIRYRG